MDKIVTMLSITEERETWNNQRMSRWKLPWWLMKEFPKEKVIELGTKG